MFPHTEPQLQLNRLPWKPAVARRPAGPSRHLMDKNNFLLQLHLVFLSRFEIKDCSTAMWKEPKAFPFNFMFRVQLLQIRN